MPGVADLMAQRKSFKASFDGERLCPGQEDGAPRRDGQLMATQFFVEPWGAFYLSVAADQRHDLQRALWMIELAVKKSPHNGLLYYQRGRVHWQLNEIGSAIADYNTAVKENDK